jgi:hypothetical protein
MTRREWTDALCRRLSDAVSREAPAGLGHWEPAWKRVEAPSRALLDALAAFEETGRAEDKQAAVRCAGDVLQAWRSAAAEWDRTGKPLTDPAPVTGGAFADEPVAARECSPGR